MYIAKIQESIVVATKKSQLNDIEIRMNTLASEGDLAGFFQWQQLYEYRKWGFP